MNFLFYRWKAYNNLDVAEALTQLGHTVHFTERECVSDDCDPDTEQYLYDLLTKEPYDGLFSINYFTVLANACHRAGVPYISWSYDAPLISMYNDSIFYPTNYCFTFDKANCEEFRAMGVAHMYHLPLAGNCARLTHLFASAQQTGEQQTSEQQTSSTKFRHVISFVGNLYGRNEYDKLKRSLPDYLTGYFDAVIRAQTQVSGGNLIPSMLTPAILAQLEQYFHLEQAPGAHSSLALVFATTVLGFKAAKVEREAYLQALSRKYPVALYTNAPTPQLPLVQNCGLADYRTATPFIYRDSKINLHFTIPNIRTGIALRVFDVLSAGGFLMTTYRPEIVEYFEPDKDLVIFEDTRELLTKADYYLTHDEARAAIAAHGQETVAARASYHMRLKAILQTVYGDSTSPVSCHPTGCDDK